MPFSISSSRAAAARRKVAAEIERLAGEGGQSSLEEAIAALVGGDVLPTPVLREALGSDGMPHLRPVLVHLAAQAGAQAATDPAAAQDVAIIAELLNCAILLHDAALGNHDGRRRRAARRVLKGAGAWLGGSHLTLRVLEIARRVPAPEIMGDALDALREVSEGQSLRASFEDHSPTTAETLQHLEARHGAVFAFACKAGGHLAHAERPIVTRLGRYGRHTGVAWHLAEDLAAFDAHDDWKVLIRRAQAGRPIFPVAWATGKEPELGRLWRQLGVEPDPALASRVAAQVRDAGGLGAGREALVQQSWSARLALGTIPGSPARDSLERIAASLAQTTN